MSARITLATALGCCSSCGATRGPWHCCWSCPCCSPACWRGCTPIPTPSTPSGRRCSAIFPFIVMFLVTSIATLRERTNGTLERLLALPTGKADFIVGYAVAFGLLAHRAGGARLDLAVRVLGLDVQGPIWLLVVVAVSDALLGTALGLFLSAFAATEFQAVQFMPLFVLPQLLVCGLLDPARRDAAGAAVVLERAAAVLRRRCHVDGRHQRHGHAQTPGATCWSSWASSSAGWASVRRPCAAAPTDRTPQGCTYPNSAGAPSPA